MLSSKCRRQCERCRTVKEDVSLCGGDQLLCTACFDANERELQQHLQRGQTSELVNHIDVSESLAHSDSEAVTLVDTNELICFLQNKMDVIPFDDLVALTADFYRPEEVEAARNCISAHLKKRFSIHKGDPKVKNRKTIADILKSCLDPSVNLPSFRAVNLARLPPVGVDHVDLSAMIQELTMLREEVRAAVNLRTELAEIRSWMKSMQSVMQDTTVEIHPGQVNGEQLITDITEAKQFCLVPTDRTSYAATASKPPSTTVLPAKRVAQPRKPVIGSRKDNSKLTSIKTQRSIDLFVSRFHPSTTNQEVIDCTSEVLQSRFGTHSIDCTKLKAKYEYLYSSFHVSILIPSSDMKCALDVLMSDAAWPDGLLVRRYFKPRYGVST